MDAYEQRYFISLDSELYITGLHITFSEEDEPTVIDGVKIEIDAPAYESVGPESRYVDGKVVQGESRQPILSADANRTIRDARIVTATLKINILIDATDPDLVDEVDPADIASLKLWKQYRLALSKVDVTDPTWPEQPA